ncbi:MAG: hypothetical protein U0822_21025 [Anaerolineae bacterium]
MWTASPAWLFIALPLLMVLPGGVALLCLPEALDRSARPGAVVEAVWRAAIAGAVLTGAVGLLLADLGLYHLGLTALIVLAATLLAWWLAGRPRPRLPRPTRADVWPLALFLLALVFFGRPHETILGAAAPGSYIAAGAQIAQHGSLALRESLLADMAPDDRAMFVRDVPETPGMPLRFPDFYVVDAAHGVSVPQVFPLHPIWLAIAYNVGGVWGSLWMLPLWGALGVLGVYFAGRWAFGEVAGGLGALALTVLAPQVWFSRYTTSEALTQVLLWAGVFAFSVYVATGLPKRLGLLAGLALGGVLLTRIDTPFILALPLGLAAWLIVRPRFGNQAKLDTLASLRGGRQSDEAISWAGGGLLRSARNDGGAGGDAPLWQNVETRHGGSLPAAFRGTDAFFVPMVVLALAAGVHALVFAGPYIRATTVALPAVIRLAELALVGLALFLAAGGAIWWAQRRGLFRRVGGTTWRGVAAVAIVALAAWAYFIRPLTGAPQTWSNWYSGTVTAYPHLSLVQLGWYLSPLGIALAAGGAAWAVYRGPLRRAWLVLAVGLFFAVLYLWNPLNSPRHIYMVRRYVPAVFPAFALYAGYAVAAVAGLIPRSLTPAPTRGEGAKRVLRAGLALVIYLAFLAGMLPETLTVGASSETAGADAQVAKLADQIDPNGIVLFAQSDPMGVAAQLATPLQFIYGRDSLLLLGQPDPDRLGRLIRGWEAAGRKVYVLADDSVSGFAPTDVVFIPAGSARLELPTLEAPFDHPPTQWLTYRSAVDVFEAADKVAVGQVTLGRSDALSLMGGWYGREGGEGATFRWTNGDASVRIPLPANAQAISIRLAGPGPGASLVDVSLNGASLGQIDAQPGMADYRLPLPAGLPALDVAVVRLTSPTFTPGAGDTRRLGVAVSRIVIE